MKDSIAENVKKVNWIWSLDKKSILCLEHEKTFWIDERPLGKGKIAYVLGLDGTDFGIQLFVGSEAEALSALDLVAKRLGAVDLLAERTSNIQAASAEWARVIKSSDMHKPPDVIYIHLDSDGLPEVYYTLPAESHCMAYIRVEYLHAAADKALERTGGVDDDSTETGNWHRGDPCEFCGVAHDDVAVGNCPGYPNDKIELTSGGAKP